MAWIYWQTPGLDALRPNIERYLQQELKLKELQLGKLSWYWSGFLWIQADRLNFSSQDNTLAFHDGHAAVRIPLAKLLAGDITPDRIRLSGGKLDVMLHGSGAAAPPGQLLLDRVRIDWVYDEWHGSIADVTLTLDGVTRSLKATAPSLVLTGNLDNDGLLHEMNLRCSHTGWLPEVLRRQLHGAAQAEIKLLRTDRLSWQAELALNADTPVALGPDEQRSLMLNKLETGLTITIADNNKMQAERIDFKRLIWSLGENRVVASGRWQQGQLSLQAESQQLEMPLIWSWLHHLGDAKWQHWLTMMHAGRANKALGELEIAWANPLQQWPSDNAWREMHYHLRADIEDADIALGSSDDYLLHTRGQVDLNQDGMRAIIAGAELPGGLGSSSGELRIPWDTLELHISGQAEADMGGLLQWLESGIGSDWQWHDSRAKGTFKLLWDPSESEPKQASAELHPLNRWHLSLFGQDLHLLAGDILWDKATGLTLSNMQIEDNHLQASLSLAAAPVMAAASTPEPHKQWQLQSLDAHIQGDLSSLAARYQIPVSDVGGNISSTLHYDGHWSGSVDMQQASWQHLLGSSKSIGEPFALLYQGELKTVDGAPTVELSKLQSRGKVLKLYGGSMSINRNRIKAQLKQMHTPAFSGSIAIEVPFDDKKPWQADLQASYLNRNALPESLHHPERMVDKRWILHASIDRFDWDEASMSGVRLNLASRAGSIGEFEAAQIHTSQLDIMDVGARFTLPGEGRVELRKFAASVEKQHLLMSATLTPQQGGGMRWSGFAELEGDFGHLIKLGGLSERFLDGQGHLLFSGQGLILREQPWWQGLDGRLRMRVDNGRILEGGSLNTLLAAINLSKLPALLFGKRDDLTGPGLKYERLQMEAIIQNQDIHIRNVAMRSTAFDLVGHGTLDIDTATVDLYLIARPLQNLDALLARVPLLRDIIGGASHSLMRKVYHMYGPFTDATVVGVEPEQAGMSSPGLIESMLALPNAWFGSKESTAAP
ncbi:MAG: hypothetical protein COW18_04400 [Zetaproteobacteria bacterium CG12_big_fil_rev_8_21_14_0_65_54_13]|nr:MAG: hypothetical protein COW18_04400 [Zetaproteobacteria bacterium CG12_big_fil_rev_8_21_14_0_65_54_13]PIX54678.1 MAG: hypothetical protein COZ50_06845 [Zetaproteobacteria bacterium CG_4_10_14_3_um_filter_54_28]PJA30780.1 MAG: hypothetical protein CO188_02000 [Zetaproteobacteria bacterium CG_4_9_14_3_um_filter_54_145]